MANAEMMAKANEKRINALERKLDSYEKEFRKSGDMSGLIKRINTLETAVKALAVTAKSSGSSDDKVQDELKDLKNLMTKRDDKLEKLKYLKNVGDPDADKKIANLEKRRELLEKTIAALNGRTEREHKESMAQIEKMKSDMDKQNKKLFETIKLESRLKILESQVRAALSKK